MTEILDFNNCDDANDINIETITKNIANIDEEMAFDFIEGVDQYISHLQSIVRLFSAFKCPNQVRKLLSNPDLKDWQIRDISKIASSITNKPYLIDGEVDEILKIILNADSIIKDIEKMER